MANQGTEHCEANEETQGESMGGGAPSIVTTQGPSGS